MTPLLEEPTLSVPLETRLSRQEKSMCSSRSEVAQEPRSKLAKEMVASTRENCTSSRPMLSSVADKRHSKGRDPHGERRHAQLVGEASLPDIPVRLSVGCKPNVLAAHYMQRPAKGENDV